MASSNLAGNFRTLSLPAHKSKGEDRPKTSFFALKNNVLKLTLDVVDEFFGNHRKIGGFRRELVAEEQTLRLADVDDFGEVRPRGYGTVGTGIGN